MTKRIIIGFGSHVPNFINYYYCPQHKKVIYLNQKSNNIKKSKQK